LVSHPDQETGRALAAGGLASFARFSVMHGKPTGPVDEGERAVLEEIARTYDMAGHFRSGSPQSKALTDEFFERFGIVGPASYCVERLRELIELGLEHVVIMGPAAGADRTEAGRAHDIMVNEVLPELR
jgi:5,10-methylenetetrahydromethanopterin reductase